MKKIAVFTGTRAEYGLLYWIIKGLHESPSAELQLYVGGMHLSPEFGKTIEQIKSDGFPVAEKLEFLLSSDTPVGIAKSMGLALIGAADALERNKPDLLVVLGDRFESMAICQAAMVAQIPIAHIHGGETTEGLIDEAVRHSISKMSHLHFTATEEYRQRVIQLGENPEHVFNVGAPGIDSIKALELLSREELSKSIDFDLTEKPYMVVTYHPVTLSRDGAVEDLKQLLLTLRQYQDHKFLITYPNADTHGRALIPLLDAFANELQGRVLLIQSLGQLRYLSALKYSDLVIGNSSSGLIEVPTFKVPTVNIGNRQKGRIAGETVISCEGDKNSILNAINVALSLEFKQRCLDSHNPYGKGDSSEKILNIIQDTKLDGLVFKSFFDIK
ncbi:UDP-N-acetylglucosamine 2-epimerase [Vibrio coralliilyticus]|uniref:UDP-N-acetylglucosamine 2-epimerase n=1 Tax=Vibrio coralliilyticus TaxID=190893 RepID=UPI0015617218|nr:UDP-N-acetylglucosamine 2-epimerase [Vibrio coralliilyticus]NRF32504.1 UDP-N-acetylglucosamine 2-epimerase (hydrolyzing) [Vibrio coralliilyticus]NRF54533.1 UDP-N-acetylglucosamine 2-epimerase (hydrolyzing) [Vibrio coralliilyticus]NRG05860.1 UDP-N-acetylglucosamine 2-epimerase (hydrolyzing) [Vibrio coralliilyticus]